MHLNKDSLITNLKDRPVAIWGARMTGIGFYRFAQKNNLNVVSFVDSDPALIDLSIGSIPIYDLLTGRGFSSIIYYRVEIDRETLPENNVVDLVYNGESGVVMAKEKPNPLRRKIQIVKPKRWETSL